MTTRADPDLNSSSVFDGINGRDVLGARTNAQGTVVVTKRGWTWFQRSGKPAAARLPDGSALIGTAAALLLALGLGLLLVSLAARSRYVLAERRQSAASMIEAAALDVGMMIFSLLALGLARGGQSAKVERALIVACAAGSALMNYAAADVSSPRSVLAYCLPPVFLAVVVDRVVVTVRRHVLGMRDGRSPWTAAGKVALYALRLVIAPASTLGGGAAAAASRDAAAGHRQCLCPATRCPVPPGSGSRPGGTAPPRRRGSWSSCRNSTARSPPSRWIRSRRSPRPSRRRRPCIPPRRGPRSSAPSARPCPPERTAPSEPRGARNEPALLLGLLALWTAAFLYWAFVPPPSLVLVPGGHDAAADRLRLHPGRRVHDPAGPVAALGHGRLPFRGLRPGPPRPVAVAADPAPPATHSVSLGRAQYRHRLWQTIPENILIIGRRPGAASRAGSRR